MDDLRGNPPLRGQFEYIPFRERAARGAALEHTAECAAADALREHGFDALRDIVLVRGAVQGYQQSLGEMGLTEIF